MARSEKLKPFRTAEWHNMCADRVHAGAIMWNGTIPPERTDQPGSSGRKESEVRFPDEKSNKEKEQQ